MDTRNSHCSYCGQSFEEAQDWPKTCASCHKKTYRNPIPVSVVLLPVDGELLVIRRNIEPKKGMLALPGGFIDGNESWQQAGKRELREETGIEISAEELRLFDVKTAPDGKILIFGLADKKRRQDIKPFTDSEIQEITYIKGPEELGFPLHTEVVHQYFQQMTTPVAPSA